MSLPSRFAQLVEIDYLLGRVVDHTQPDLNAVRRLMDRGIPPRFIAMLGHWAARHWIHLHGPHVSADAIFRTSFTLIESAVHAFANDLRAARSPHVGS